MPDPRSCDDCVAFELLRSTDSKTAKRARACCMECGTKKRLSPLLRLGALIQPRIANKKEDS